MEHISQQLRRLGLGDHEALVYSVLLQNSPVNATFLAKKCALARSSVYTTLGALISKGLVSTSYKNETKQFSAEDPEVFENLLLKEKENLAMKFELLKNIQNQVQTLRSNDLHIPQVTFFEGQEGLKKIYLSMMQQARQDSVLYLLRDEFVWQKEWIFIFEEEWHARVKRIRTEKNISTKLLVNNSELERTKEQYYKERTGLEYRFLTLDTMVNKFAVYIMEDMVSILSMENNNLMGIKIINQHMADNFLSMFEGLWGESR